MDQWKKKIELSIVQFASFSQILPGKFLSHQILQHSGDVFLLRNIWSQSSSLFDINKRWDEFRLDQSIMPSTGQNANYSSCGHYREQILWTIRPAVGDVSEIPTDPLETHQRDSLQHQLSAPYKLSHGKSFRRFHSDHSDLIDWFNSLEITGRL